MNSANTLLSAEDQKRIDWYLRARFGMFIHWGVYSLPASGECLLYRTRYPLDEYKKYAKKFRAERYNPDEWVEIARSAGMRYMVLTTKHTDGYCLFDTCTTDFCSTKIGPGQDLVAQYVRACRKARMKVGLYYNLRDISCQDYNYGPGDKRWKPYVERVHLQFEELMSRYGKIDYLWIDQTAADPLFMEAMEVKKLGEAIRRLQPDIVMTKAFGERGFGDIAINECALTGDVYNRLWELCDTFNLNWGYHRFDRNWKSVREIANKIAMCAHNGGNYLLNVGPKPDGTIPKICVSRLRELGKWIFRNREAVYDVSPHPFEYSDQTLSVARGNTVYIFIAETGLAALHWNRPKSDCHIQGIGNKILSVRLLGENKVLPFSQNDDSLRVILPTRLPDPVLSVLKIELDGKPSGIRKYWWHCGIGPIKQIYSLK